MYKTFQYRIKDAKVKYKLREKACAVNFVWNFCNETQKHALKWGKKWVSNYDLDKLTAGSSKELGLHSQTIQSISEEYVTRRNQFNKSSLRWRSNKKSLPWIPFKVSGLRINRETGETKYSGLEFNLWYSRPFQGEVKSGSICADSSGRWFLNLVCKIPEVELNLGPELCVGVDLGLKDLVTLSSGEKEACPKFYRKSQSKIAKAQSKKRKCLVQKLHRKVRNQRRDFNHKLSHDLVNSFDAIFVGDVSSSRIIEKPNMAKSVLDAGWFQLKSFLRYKALASGKLFMEVSERYSTQTCSACGCIPDSSPKGKSGLSIRNWICSDCGAEHDRDINAANNILQSGLRLLQNQILVNSSIAGIPCL